MINTMVADDLATHRAKASADIQIPLGNLIQGKVMR